MEFLFYQLNTLLHICAMRCDHACLLAVLGRTPNLDAADKNGMTPLHVAASTGCLHISASLLQAGANPNAKDNVRLLLSERFLST